MKLEIQAVSDKGAVRERNEDAVKVRSANHRLLFGRTKLPIMVLADGMGGHGGGDIASGIAVSVIDKHLSSLSPDKNDLVIELKKAVRAANTAIRTRAAQKEALRQMGTTVLAATAYRNELFVANVGDSRCYYADNMKETIEQVTIDHSVVERKRRQSQDTSLIKRNIITRAVGRSEELKVDVFIIPWDTGDSIILCSDGLWSVVSAAQMCIVTAELEPKKACQKLYEMAITGGSRDNVSVIVAKRMA